MSAGALRMKRSRPRITTARSSSCPSTGTKSGMRSFGKKRYAPNTARMCFCCAGTRPSRRSAQTRRMYVGRRRMRSTTSAMSFGARMRLANTHVSLREPCPKRAKCLSERRIAVGRPERNEILVLAVGHAAELNGRRRLRSDPLCLRERRAYVFRGDYLLVSRKYKPCGGAPRRKTRQIHDRRSHERAVRDDHLATVIGSQLRRAE